MSSLAITCDGTDTTVILVDESMTALPGPMGTWKWSPDAVVKPTAVTDVGDVKLVPVMTRFEAGVPTGVLVGDRAVTFELLSVPVDGVSGMTGRDACPLESVESTCWPLLQVGVA